GHRATTAFEHVRPAIGVLNLRTDTVSQRHFGYLVRVARSFGTPIPEGRTEAVHGVLATQATSALVECRLSGTRSVATEEDKPIRLQIRHICRFCHPLQQAHRSLR